MTYQLIQEQVLGSAQSSVTFSSIPGTYNDLVFEIFGYGTNNDNDVLVRFNGDSNTNYSRTYVYGSGTQALSGRQSNIAQTYVTYGANSTQLGMTTLQIQSYASTNVAKTMLSRHDNANTVAFAQVSLWRISPIVAITSVVFSSANQIAAGSTFRLWGVS